jgi:hypothetical protein
MIHRFYKDHEGWFIDLPEFLELGLGTKGNLAMVLGADTFLDKLSNNGTEVTLELAEYDNEIENPDGMFKNIGFSEPTEDLEEVGHPIQRGGDYIEVNIQHKIWLCPVTMYVFGGYYPHQIYYKVVK